MRKILISLAGLIFCSGVSFAAPSVRIGGGWMYQTNDSSFVLRLSLKGGHLNGVYCSVMRGGAKIDCPPTEAEKNISGTYDGATGRLNFHGFFDPAASGEATVTVSSDKHVNWALSDHHGDLFLPIKAALKRDESVEVINVEKAFIYKAPSVSKPTRAYFIQGDVVAVVERNSTGWIKVRYAKSKKFGWIPYEFYADQ
jgi:hypothetical protein